MTWYNPFSSKGKSNNVLDDVLISGDDISLLKADGVIERRQFVTIDDDYTATPTDSWDRVFGVALYDATDGEDLAAATFGTEVRLWANEQISAGDTLTPADSLSVKTDNSKMPMLVAYEDAKEGDLVEVALSGK